MLVRASIVLAMVALLAPAAPARAGFPGHNGLIAWSRTFLMKDGEIYGIDQDGSNEHALTNNDQNDFDPAWSPDGRTLAFASSTQSDLDVWVLHGDGTEVNVTNDPGFADGGPAWSPDGTQIVFDRANPFTGDGPLVVMNADGSNKHAITDGASVNTAPAWSPDGATIVFGSDRDGNLELYRIDPDGTDLKRLTFTPTTWEENPNWSPDGSMIAFDACEAPSFPCPGTPNYEIFTMRADGLGRTRLTFQDGIDAHPAWSPDGSLIAFRSDRTGNTEIWEINADGSNPTELTFGPFEGGVDPDWQPRP